MLAMRVRVFAETPCFSDSAFDAVALVTLAAAATSAKLIFLLIGLSEIINMNSLKARTHFLSIGSF